MNCSRLITSTTKIEDRVTAPKESISCCFCNRFVSKELIANCESVSKTTETKFGERKLYPHEIIKAGKHEIFEMLTSNVSLTVQLPEEICRDPKKTGPEVPGEVVYLGRRGGRVLKRTHQTQNNTSKPRGSAARNKPRMAPYITNTPTGMLFEDDMIDENVAKEPSKEKYKVRIVWRNVILFAYLHLAALYGAYLIFTSAKLMTTAFALMMVVISCLGITAGAHRLWSHRAYSATWPLQVLLVTFNTIAFQDAAIDWAKDHRVHHKYSETNADPYNAKRGFFFAHIGWLLCRKHPDVREKGKGIDISDLENNPILAFQKRYYHVLMPLLCFIIPTVVPVVCWNETWSNAFFVATILRYALALNCTWLVNSAAHMYGNKPYDKFIDPCENVGIAIVALGEGWHNFHHVFPWDYKTSELGDYRFNVTTAFLDFFAKIGWAYDLKTVSEDIVRKRVKRTGNGSHQLWGWSDPDQTQEDRDRTVVTHSLKKD